MGKGDNRRPTDESVYRDEHERIFGSKEDGQSNTELDTDDNETDLGISGSTEVEDED